MRAYVGVGSNLGDRWRSLAFAVQRLREGPRVAILRSSRVYDTEPVGPPQPRYLNAVLELETGLQPKALLALLQLTERAAGRRRGIRWGARPLDLDLLLYGDRVLETPALSLPHPGLAWRRFVLAPLAELCPDRVVPGTGRTVAQLLAVAPPFRVAVAGMYPR